VLQMRLAVRTLTFGLAALVLAGCESRQLIWQQLTQNTTVTFFAPVSCAGALNQSLSVIGPYSLTRSFRWGGGLQGIYDPALHEEFSGNRYAYALTVIDADGRDERLSAFLLGASDAIGSDFSLPYIGRGPGSFRAMTVGPPGTNPERIYPIPTNVSTCGYLHRMPWSSSLNLPYWISADLMNPDAPDNYKLAIDLALVGLAGFVLLALFCLLCLPFGFFDIDADQERTSTRFRSCKVFFIGFGVVFASLFWLRNMMETSLDELLRGQSYYDFYQNLPKSNGLLQPVSYFDAQRLLAGPPTPEQMTQSPQIFWFVVCAALLAGAIKFGMRIYKGWYWLFVPLPLQVRFERAMRRGEWLRAEELIMGILEGTTRQNAWQSKAMAKKAELFARKLIARRVSIERRMMA
jgi:hypothetical protein